MLPKIMIRMYSLKYLNIECSYLCFGEKNGRFFTILLQCKSDLQKNMEGFS